MSSVRSRSIPGARPEDMILPTTRTRSRSLGASLFGIAVVACGGGGGSDMGGLGGAAGANDTGGTTAPRGGSNGLALAGNGGNGGIENAGGAPSSGGGVAGASTGGGHGGSGLSGEAGVTGGVGAAAGSGQGGQSASGGAVASGGSSSAAGAAGQAGAGDAAALSFTPSEHAYSYPRTTANGPTQSFRLMNAGQSAATVNLSLSGATPGAFKITSPANPANVLIAAGSSLEIGVQLVPNGTGVPAAPPADNGGATFTAKLMASGAGSTVHADLFGLVMTIAGEGSGAEPTLGQILATLGYDVDVGSGLKAHLANSTSAAPQGSEVALPRFVRAGSGPVTLRTIARFSPSGAMPFGYYTAAAPNCADAASYSVNCHVVGTMASNNDANTSDGSRMLDPPVSANGDPSGFDPGTQAFGIWSYTDQASQKVSSGGNATNGDYAYSDDKLNSPANMHRVRVWPLRDRAGNPIANSYLLGIEEASNGDYQDYLFVLTNVKAP